jgi:thioredoxin 1
MGKSILFIMVLICLLRSSGHCLAQGIQNMKQSSGAQSAIIDTTAVKVTGGTKILTKVDFLQKIWNYEVSPRQWVFLGDKPAIIDFYADWCGPCKIAAPILEEVSNEFAGQIDVYKIDTQREQELAAVFGIRSIPAFLYIPKIGKPSMVMGIARTKEDTRQMFIDNINNLLLQGK